MAGTRASTGTNTLRPIRYLDAEKTAKKQKDTPSCAKLETQPQPTLPSVKIAKKPPKAPSCAKGAKKTTKAPSCTNLGYKASLKQTTAKQHDKPSAKPTDPAKSHKKATTAKKQPSKAKPKEPTKRKAKKKIETKAKKPKIDKAESDVAEPLNENAAWLVRRISSADAATRATDTSVSDFAEKILVAIRSIPINTLFVSDYETEVQMKLFHATNDGKKRDMSLIFDVRDKALDLRDDKKLTANEIQRAAAYCLSNCMPLNDTPVTAAEKPAGADLTETAGSFKDPYAQFNLLKRSLSTTPEPKDIIPVFSNYFHHLGKQPFCTNMKGKNRGNAKACSCLTLLADESCRLAVSSACADHARRSFEEKREWLMVNARYATYSQTNTHCFHLPSNHEGNRAVADKLNNHKVCLDAFMQVMGFRKDRWKVIVDLVSGVKESVAHKLKGKIGDNANAKTDEHSAIDVDLHTFFKGLFAECDVQATRFVRLETGQVLERDSNDKNRYLSPCMSKIYIYSRFCFHRGWHIYFDGTGRATKQKRPAVAIPKKEYLMPFEGDAQSIPSWTKFLDFWKQSYPHLKINSSAEDLCGDCYRYHNQEKYADSLEAFHHVTGGKRQEGEEQKCGMISHECNHKVKEVEDAEFNDADMHFEAEEACDDPIDERRERLVLTLARHVTAARLQRKLVIHKITTARKYAANPESNKKVYTLVVDYCQNLQYPWYGERQPGETYYYPHVRVYCLGIVDVADITVTANGEPDAKLHAHLYSEGEGDGHKGGNNVASLIMKQLEAFGWLKDIKYGKYCV